MADFNVLREYYIRYLRDVRNSSEATVNHYLGALNVISKYLNEHGKIDGSIYEVGELSELEILRAYLYSQPDFKEKDERGRRMYSAGLNNYLRFAQGEEFSGLDAMTVKMDIEVPVGDCTSVTVEHWKRSGIIKRQSIEMAHYLCENNPEHITFTSASTGHQYMEGHHAIPIRKQENFMVSLDVYANIVCLCPICHRLMHYGLDGEKQIMIKKIYNERADRLANSGIKLSREEFVSLAM